MRYTLALLLGMVVVLIASAPAAAMYDPSIGRFIQRDTIGVWGDAMGVGNGVAYVASNPMRHVDPLGLDAWIEDTKRIGGTHRRVCVDTWSDDCSRKTGKHCVSFGGTGISESSSSTCGGNPTNVDPRNDGNGIIYHDRDNDGTGAARTKSQGCQDDKEMLRHMKEADGRRMGYCPGVNDCRNFSEEFLDDPSNDRWRVRPLTTQEQQEREEVRRRQEQWRHDRHKRNPPPRW
jgi:hypothetical protein